MVRYWALALASTALLNLQQQQLDLNPAKMAVLLSAVPQVMD
jgi:hypothetical protein